MSPRKKKTGSQATTASYQHTEARALIRPEAGAQTRFKKKKPTATWRYDSSLAPELQWDAGNPAREQGETYLAAAEAALAALAAQPDDKTALHAARAALAALKSLSRPFLNWAGKAERLSFDVPTLPLFIHERLSTQAILDSVSQHRLSQQGDWINDFYGHPDRSLPEQLLKAYEHPNGWQNRMILGDSLVVMNSLLHYENMGGQVQTIYIDPPYGVKFGSNFQPFVRKRDVSPNADEDMSREPEMVKAYRDTWELGLHSYLTYLRDRLLLAQQLLTDSGSVFVQISDENLHHVREVMDEVFGAENAVVVIPFKKKSATTPRDPVNDYLVWYAKSRPILKLNRLYQKKDRPEDDPKFNTLISPSWDMKRVADMSEPDIARLTEDGWRWARVNYPLVSQDSTDRSTDYPFNGKSFSCGKNRHWTFSRDGMDRLVAQKRIFDGGGKSLGGVVFWDDWPFVSLSNFWDDIHGDPDPQYVVQTSYKAIQRCILMTTDPGDLVLDPTCGSGTTAVVAEQWGRRWITVDTSRVPLALARQRLLTATFAYHELKEPSRGPAGGFVYKEKKNRKGEHVGGIVPHITLGSIANNEPPKYEVLVDRPESISGITRVCGPFVVEATIPTASNFDGEKPLPDGAQDAAQDFIERMIEVLRASPVLHLAGGKSVQLSGIRRPAKTLWLSAEAQQVTAATDESGDAVALLFGPEHGSIAEVAVLEAWQEATAKQFTHLYIIGFAIEPKARQFVEDAGKIGLPATYVQATPDILMGDLLKNMRSSQIFSVCGQPDVQVNEVAVPEGAIPNQAYYEVKLNGLDVFDPVTMEIDSRAGLDVPAWFLDTDYNGLVFRVCQAFFPRTQAWDNLKRALKADFDESVWAHLAGDTSTPFAAGQHKQIAVKVIDDRGNELMVVKKLEEGK